MDAYAAAGSNLGSLNRSPRTIIAQAMRAILLASATAATLTGRRPIRRTSQSRFVPCRRAYRMTAIAPATSSHRKCRLPCFDILPSLSLPPVECCRGTKPIQAAKLRPDENAVQSPTSATRAVASSRQKPDLSRRSAEAVADAFDAGRVVAASQITHQRRLRLLAQSLGNFRSRGRRETPSESATNASIFASRPRWRSYGKNDID